MVNSVVWTAEEAKYLKALLRWQDAAPPRRPEDERRPRTAAAAPVTASEVERRRQKQQQSEQVPRPIPQSQQKSQQPVGEFRVLVVGARGTGKTAILTRFGQDTFRGSGKPPDPFYERGCRHPLTLEDGRVYVVDALEMPSKHLLSNPMLAQAVDITEAAVLVYDVGNAASLRLAEGLAEFILDHITSSGPGGRHYGLLLVGNKSDLDDSIAVDDKDVGLASERELSLADGAAAAARIRLPPPSPPPSSSAFSPETKTAAPCPFLEVSAKTGANVDAIFPLVAHDILRLRRLNMLRYRERAEHDRRLKLLTQQSQLPPPAPPPAVARRTPSRGAASTTPSRKRAGLWKGLFSRRQSESAY
ncbi:P-loop containing nucleoside triphosphate hydrolase protein [Lasiosphaeria ovina]|uniref:P-loop containing nucleoside triphosphate hydrolase protein n=1 Tax=Lasiosphaeria ovina TaxID=92902 RepID=A0AAE0KAU7_9PEZI|nr:P-loop containing nucleoside triphosphate hydrolase protein [Lasiosphaeria ovina]